MKVAIFNDTLHRFLMAFSIHHLFGDQSRYSCYSVECLRIFSVDKSKVRLLSVEWCVARGSHLLPVLAWPLTHSTGSHIQSTGEWQAGIGRVRHQTRLHIPDGAMAKLWISTMGIKQSQEYSLVRISLCSNVIQLLTWDNGTSKAYLDLWYFKFIFILTFVEPPCLIRGRGKTTVCFAFTFRKWNSNQFLSGQVFQPGQYLLLFFYIFVLEDANKNILNNEQLSVSVLQTLNINTGM